MKVTKNYFDVQERSICYHVFLPEGNPIALVQIIHDASEHILCYGDLAKHLTDRGVIVCGCDLRGHAESVEEGKLGHFGEGKDLQILLDDQKTLYDLMRKKYRYLPYLLLGQGIGGIVARLWMSEHHESVDGVMLSGVCQPKMNLAAAHILAKLTALSGKDKPAPVLEEKLFGKGTMPSLAQEDLPTAFPLTAGALLQVLSSYGRVAIEEWTETIEQGLPVAIFCGAMDSVGKGAEGGSLLHERLSMAELCTLSLKIYEKSGHFLHLSDEKEQYFADVEAFALQVAEGVRAARTASWY